MATTPTKSAHNTIPVANEVALRCDHFRYKMFGKIVRVVEDNLMEFYCKACSKFYTQHFKSPHGTFHYYNMAGELVETITKPFEKRIENKYPKKKECDKVNVNTK